MNVIDERSLFYGEIAFFTKVVRTTAGQTQTIIEPRSGKKIAIVEVSASGPAITGGGFNLRWHDGSSVRRNIWGTPSDLVAAGLNARLLFGYQPDVSDQSDWRLEWATFGVSDLSIAVLGYYIPKLSG